MVPRVQRFIWVITMPLFLAGAAVAREFTVDSSEDLPDAAAGNGVCSASNGKCTLRAATQEANASAGADTIIVPAGVYRLSIAGTSEQAGATGDLDVTSDTTIRGEDPATTILDGASLDRILDIQSGAVTIEKLTFRNGATQFEGGGAMRNRGRLAITNCVFQSNVAGSDGGALLNESAAPAEGTITAAAFMNNRGMNGGAIANFFSVLFITQSTVSDNSCSAEGGGIFNVAGGTLAADRITVSANRAGARGGGLCGSGSFNLLNTTVSGNVAALGGAMYVAPGGAVTLNNSTFVNNSVLPSGIGGGLYDDSGTSSAKNSIIANNAAGDCGGSALVRPSNNNLTSDSTCRNPGPGSMTADPHLGPLQQNGGGIATHLLLPGSPAIDTGDNQSCDSNSANGVTRPQDGNGDGSAVCDIGAVEVMAATPSADLHIVKLGPESVTPGEEITYSISVLNHGPATAVDVRVDDQTPAGLTFVLNSGTCTTPYPCVLGTLAAEDVRAIVTKFRVSADYSGANPPRNVASVSSSTPDPSLQNNSATASPRRRRRSARP